MPEETGRQTLDMLHAKATPLPWIGEVEFTEADVRFAIALANAWPEIKSDGSELSAIMLQYKEAFEALMEMLAAPVMKEARRNKWGSSLSITPGGTKRMISQFLGSVGFARLMELRQKGPMSAAQYKVSQDAGEAAQKAGGNSKGLISPN